MTVGQDNRDQLTVKLCYGSESVRSLQKFPEWIPGFQVEPYVFGFLKYSIHNRPGNLLD
jgi:hypothetical protein